MICMSGLALLTLYFDSNNACIIYNEVCQAKWVCLTSLCTCISVNEDYNLPYLYTYVELCTYTSLSEFHYLSKEDYIVKYMQVEKKHLTMALLINMNTRLVLHHSQQKCHWIPAEKIRPLWPSVQSLGNTCKNNSIQNQMIKGRSVCS